MPGIGTILVIGGDLSGDVSSHGNVSVINVMRNALTGHGGNVSGAFHLDGGLLSLAAIGGNLSGSLNVGGSVGSLSLIPAGAGGNVLAGASVRAGAIGYMSAGSFQGVSGNRVSVNAGSIGLLYVTGEMTYTEIQSSGDITNAIVGGMANSAVFAGVSNPADSNGDGVWDLPGTLSDYSLAHSGIGSFTLLGLTSGGSPSDSFINSNIAAWKLGSVSLAYAQGSNGHVSFGVACDQYGLLLYRDANGAKIWFNSSQAARLPGDGVVSVLTN
jgi:hypothetical protein